MKSFPIKPFLIFLIINFLALAIGGFATRDGVISDWYTHLNKAPWTPPGWFFGFAWSIIMICFAVYMAKAYQKVSNRSTLLGLYIFQWILNVSWNPVFFSMHKMTLGLIIISTLLILLIYMLRKYAHTLGSFRYWIYPYIVWLTVATSLNLYAVLYN